jgi:hypothetical protein
MHEALKKTTTTTKLHSNLIDHLPESTGMDQYHFYDKMPDYYTSFIIHQKR